MRTGEDAHNGRRTGAELSNAVGPEQDRSGENRQAPSRTRTLFELDVEPDALETQWIQAFSRCHG
jgi:hypothetical protein